MSLDPQSGTISAILSAISTQIVTALTLDPSAVRIVASDHYELYFPSEGDLLICIRPYGFEPDTDSGAGRGHRRGSRLLRVYLYYRSNLDQAGEDVAALTATGAFFDTEEHLFSCLDEFWPMSSAPTPAPLTIEPLHPLNSAEGPVTRKSDDDIGVLTAHFDFEFKYVLVNVTPIP